MKHFALFLGACLVLSGCGDPLAKVDRLSDEDIAQTAPTVDIAAQPVSANQGGFLSRFRRGAETAPALTPSAALAQAEAGGAAEAATTKALRQALSEQGATTAPAEAQISQTQTSGDAATAAASAEAASAQEKRRGGLFGLFSRKAPAVASAASLVPSETQAAQVAATPAAEISSAKTAAVAAPEASAQPPAKRGGFFKRLAQARSDDTKAPSQAEAVAAGSQVRTASLARMPAAPKPKRRRARRAHKGPDTQVVPFGTALPPGVVARVCDMPAGRLGQQVEKYPARGRGYKLFDSRPGSSGTRPFYITGFEDRCARTFTAALAMFGSATMHERLRYGLPSKSQPYSLTDKAYEGIKSKICRVGRKKACGARITQLEKDTVFVSFYDRLGSNAQWSNVLLHDGWVLAADRKGGR